MTHHFGGDCQHISQVVIRQPTLALAPTVWIALLSISLATDVPFATLSRENKPVLFTQRQRRRFAKYVRLSLVSPSFNAGIRAYKLRRSYPHRLRQNGYITPSTPTVTLRANFCNFETLKERTSRFQRRKHASVVSVATQRNATQSNVLRQPQILQIHSLLRLSQLIS